MGLIYYISFLILSNFDYNAKIPLIGLGCGLEIEEITLYSLVSLFFCKNLKELKLNLSFINSTEQSK
jgi:hypothetical protein